MSDPGQTYPDVPDVAGVPNIPRNPDDPIDQPQLLDGDAVLVSGNAALPNWGIMLNNEQVLKTADSFATFEYGQDWTIADYQIEQGAFSSYDKVALPFDVKIMLTCGGNDERRADFLTEVKALVGDLNLYTVVTPEDSFQNCNCKHWGYKRTATDGATLLKVDLYFLEVRANVQTEFSQVNSSPASPDAVQDPGSSAQVNDGLVQTQDVATLQPPESASSMGATGIASDQAALNATSATLTGSSPTQNIPLETPANQAAGPHFTDVPAYADGLAASPGTAPKGITYILNTQTGGSTATNTATGLVSQLPAGAAPQSLGFQ